MSENQDAGSIQDSPEDSAHPPGEGSMWDSAWIPAMAAFALSVLSTVGIVAFYHHRFAFQDGLAMVDIAALVREREAQFTALLSKPDVQDKDRLAAYEIVKNVGPQIERGIDLLQQECRCTILVKGAVVAGDVPDLTGRLRELIAGGGR